MKPSNSQHLVFTNAAVLDLDQGMRPGASLRIENGRIGGIRFGGPLEIRPDDTVIDLQGKSIIPGLFSCHFHATYNISDGNGPTFPVGMEAPPALQAMRAVKHVGMALDCGFTSLISAGAPLAIDASLKAAIAEGTIRGPRIMAGSRDVSTTGHSQDMWLPWHWGIDSPPGVNLVDGPDAFARAMRQEVKRGAEIIKMFLSVGHGVQGIKAAMEMSREELRAAVQAAHGRSAKVRVHVANRDAIIEAIEAGMDVIDHGDGMDQTCIDLMLKNGTFLVPSMLFPYRLLDVRKGAAYDKIKAAHDQMSEILPVANKAGVKILIGDDFGAIRMYHGDYADELDFYVNVVGIPALDVLSWATRNGAELMGKSDELGKIEAGRLADLVVVDGDPVADIAVLRDKSKILAVLKDGRFEKDALDTLEPKEKQAVA